MAVHRSPDSGDDASGSDSGPSPSSGSDQQRELSNYVTPSIGEDIIDSGFGPMLAIGDSQEPRRPNLRVGQAQTESDGSGIDSDSDSDDDSSSSSTDRAAATVSQQSRTKPSTSTSTQNPQRHTPDPRRLDTQFGESSSRPAASASSQAHSTARRLTTTKSDVERWLNQGLSGEDEKGKSQNLESSSLSRSSSSSSSSSSSGSIAQTRQERSRRAQVRQGKAPQPVDTSDEKGEDDYGSSIGERLAAITSAPEQATAGLIEHLDQLSKQSAPGATSALTHSSRRRKGEGPAATADSRRRSLDSLAKVPTISVRVPTDLSSTESAAVEAISSERPVYQRTTSGQRKRKPEEPDEYADTEPSEGGQAQTQPNVRRLSSSKRPKSPRLGLGSTSQGRGSSSPQLRQPGATTVRRVRSRSDVGIGRASRSLVDPAIIAEHSTSLHLPPALVSLGTSEDGGEGDDDDDLSGTSVEPGFGSLSAPVMPSYESFISHTLQANPQIKLYLLERFVNEQLKRLRRLGSLRLAHCLTVANGQCSSGQRCAEAGQGPLYLAPRRTSRSSDSPAVVFYIVSHESMGDISDIPVEVSPQAANFPDGVPPPPVRRLPAEFECPLCFEVKTCWKPSDWTKHVHEDLQPFTCTWPECTGERKSFKRKADWIRHENERHRHLEMWTCSMEGCNHVCYRNDNFIQHLVRQHRLPEPPARRSRSRAAASSSGPEENIIPSLVKSCHAFTDKLAEHEPCRFCGLVSRSWKKATAHLSKHMEQLSLPLCGMLRNIEPATSSIMEMVERELKVSQQTLSAAMANIEEELASQASSPSVPVPSGSHSPADLTLHMAQTRVSSSSSMMSEYMSHVPISNDGTLSHVAWSPMGSPHDLAGDVVYRTRTEGPPTPTLPSSHGQYPGFFGQSIQGDRYSSIPQSMAGPQDRRNIHTYPPAHGEYIQSLAGHVSYPSNLLAGSYSEAPSGFTQSPRLLPASDMPSSATLAPNYQAGGFASTYPQMLMPARGSTAHGGAHLDVGSLQSVHRHGGSHDTSQAMHEQYYGGAHPLQGHPNPGQSNDVYQQQQQQQQQQPQAHHHHQQPTGQEFDEQEFDEQDPTSSEYWDSGEHQSHYEGF